MLGMWDVGDVGYSRCEMLEKWDVRDVICWEYGMLRMWGIGDVECSRCGMFEVWDVREVRCSGCGMFGLWDLRDVRCLRCEMFGMWDVGCLPGCGMLIYEMPWQVRANQWTFMHIEHTQNSMVKSKLRNGYLKTRFKRNRQECNETKKTLHPVISKRINYN